MKRFHIALSSDDLPSAVADYTRRLGVAPCVIVPDEYVLFRTQTLNVSIRHDPMVAPGQLRHLGWEDPDAVDFGSDRDAMGILWESFNGAAQAQEIEAAWPNTDCSALLGD